MKKIMFNDKCGLTQAVLEGRKTQTRRIVTDRLFQECRSNGFIEAGGFNDEWKNKSLELLVKNSPYKIGEEVAVAQRYRDVCHEVFLFSTKVRGKEYRKGWGNKMFVKADLMPHRIKINNIRIERLQDISDEDCLKEGIKRKNNRYCVENYKGVCFYTNDPKLAFRCLINKTCGKGTWESNPWVFVYEFEIIK